ncbi:hypothetical protein [Klebsiella variicola]|uniref:hypothetical protein n=1 Tax=Klebsiella variicola TaxID=244366 RepID=UPI0013158AF5|nr:hypothetical protein [Klebsiella variicola]ELI6991624.1 hypothetical protein [Klebsiella pneumoniae]
MNEETNFRRFWQNTALTTCWAICSLLVCLPAVYLSFHVFSVVWEALWLLITTK